MWSRLEPRSLPISCLDRLAIRRRLQALVRTRPCEGAADRCCGEIIEVNNTCRPAARFDRKDEAKLRTMRSRIALGLRAQCQQLKNWISSLIIGARIGVSSSRTRG